MFLNYIPELNTTLSLKGFKVTMRVDVIMTRTAPSNVTIIQGRDLRNGRRRYQFTVWPNNEVLRVAVIK